MRVGYAGQNGRAYVAIGKLMVERGLIPREQVSMQSIRAWLGAHPDKARALMDENPSYVFFRTLGDVSPDQGPPGALGVKLTPERSVAVDPHFVPLGAPLWIDADGFRRLVLAQDTGGAIKGAVRADIFFGWGKAAGERAGTTKARGRAWMLLPRAATS
jgi:membrane-bound lytic murein transglycosylase A